MFPVAFDLIDRFIYLFARVSDWLFYSPCLFILFTLSHIVLITSMRYCHCRPFLISFFTQSLKQRHCHCRPFIISFSPNHSIMQSMPQFSSSF